MRAALSTSLTRIGPHRAAASGVFDPDCVEALARRLCKRERLDPEMAVTSGEPARLWTPEGVRYHVPETAPLWRSYTGLARDILAGGLP